MFLPTLHRTLALAAGLALLAPAAIAATITVSPKGPLPTIQEGVDAAGPGDTVNVKAGRYNENVVIADRDGLRLIAKGKVILDAFTEENGPGIVVESDGVLVQGFTIRNAAEGDVLDGLGISIDGEDVSVSKCTLERCEDGIVGPNAERLTISGCTFFAMEDRVIEVAGDDIRVLKCKARQNGDGVRIDGARALVSGNTFEKTCSLAFQVVGDDALVTGNSVQGSAAGGIDIFGQDATVTKNRLTQVCDEAIYVTGTGALVERNTMEAVGYGIAVIQSGGRILSNRISASGSDAISTKLGGHRIERNTLQDVVDRGIIGTGPGNVIDRNKLTRVTGEGIRQQGDDVTITGNTIKEVYCSDEGIHLSGSTGGVVADNRISDVTRPGIFLNACHDIMVSNNRLDRIGDGSDHGIEATGSGHEIVGNRVVGASRDGIHVAGTDIELRDNTIDECGEDGIDLEDGSGHVVTGNLVTDSRAEGIENNSTDAVIDDNTAKNNRTDFASDGTELSFVGNTSSDGTDEEPGKPVVD